MVTRTETTTKYILECSLEEVKYLSAVVSQSSIEAGRALGFDTNLAVPLNQALVDAIADAE